MCGYLPGPTKRQLWTRRFAEPRRSALQAVLGSVFSMSTLRASKPATQETLDALAYLRSRSDLPTALFCDMDTIAVGGASGLP